MTLGVVTAKVQMSPLNQSLWDLLQESGKSQTKYDSSTVSDIVPIKALCDTSKNVGVQTSNEALLKRITMRSEAKKPCSLCAFFLGE